MPGVDPGGLEDRALRAVADLDPATLAAARWTGLVGMSSFTVHLIEAFEFDDGGAVAIVGLGPEPGPEAGSLAEPTLRLTVPLAGPDPWAGLHRLAGDGGSVAGLMGGRLIGHPGRAVAARTAADGPRRTSKDGIATRMSPGDQSHTSVIIDERSMLKLYRRLVPGTNPEAEILSALDGIGGSPVPDWIGAVEYIGRDGSTATTIAIEQAYVAGSDDVFETVADALAAWLTGTGPRVATDVLGATGRATAALHLAMARMSPSDATVTGDPPAGKARLAWLEAAERALDEAIAALRTIDPDFATQVADAAPAIRRAFAPLGKPTPGTTVQRIHGDLHLGQVLRTGDEVLIVDFEGDPTRDPLTRREPGPRLRDIAGLLRSIDHVARSGRRRAVVLHPEAYVPLLDAVIDSWIEHAESDFLGEYWAGLDEPDPLQDWALLRALEMEKELGELVYAAQFLPTWLYAPRAGLEALLGRVLSHDRG